MISNKVMEKITKPIKKPHYFIQWHSIERKKIDALAMKESE